MRVVPSIHPGIVALHLGAFALMALWLIAGPTDWSGLPLGVAIAGAVLTYLAGHALRGLRLFLLLYDDRLRLGQVVLVHGYTAALSRLIPFKLGELWRVWMLWRMVGDPPRAVVAVVAERLFDLPVLLGIVAILHLAGVRLGPEWGPVCLAGVAFLLLGFFAFLVLPENLTLLQRYVVTRHNRPWCLRVLVVLEHVLSVLTEARRVIARRWAALAWITVLIWLLEAGSLALILAALPAADLAAMTGLLHGMLVGNAWAEASGPEMAVLGVGIGVLVGPALIGGLLVGARLLLSRPPAALLRVQP